MSWISFLENSFSQYSDKVAIIDDDLNQKWSYNELINEGNRLAAFLHEKGTTRGDRVAIHSKNRIEHLTLLLACAKLGAILVPLNTRLTQREIKEILLKVNAQVIFHSYCLDNDSLVATHKVDFHELGEYSTKEKYTWSDVCLSEPLMMLFSSGTTGEPKGILLHGQMLKANQEATCEFWKLQSDDVTLVSTPFFHTGGYNVLCLPLLAIGGTVILTKQFDAGRTIQLIEKYQVSVYFGVPSIFELIAREENFINCDLSSIRFLISGGAYCPISLIKKYQHKDITFKQGFGLSEVGPNCFLLEARDAISKVGSIGKAMPHTHVIVVDEDNHEVPCGNVGELLLAGDHVCAGYYDDDALFNKSSLNSYFKTGDLVQVDKDGFFYIVGRKKEMYISGGENVYPAEVEKNIGEHPDVLNNVIVSVTDEKWGEVGVAFIEQAKSSENISIEGLRLFLNNRLSRYKHPQYIKRVEQFEYLDNGKINRKILLNKLKQKSEYDTSHF
jgi:fatty-acyl-CoA synthase